MDCHAGSAQGGATWDFAFTGTPPPARPPVDGSRCMTCPVRGQCIGGVAAHAGTRQLLAVLDGRRQLRAGEAMLLPAGSVLAVRSGFLKSTAPEGDTARPRGFHLPGEAVDGGRHGVRLVALEDAEVCVMRAGLAGGAGPYLGRLWDMLSREEMRERAQANWLAGLPPARRVAALLASLAVRARAPGSRARFLRLSAADVAGFLGLPLAEVEREAGVTQGRAGP